MRCPRQTPPDGERRGAEGARRRGVPDPGYDVTGTRTTGRSDGSTAGARYWSSAPTTVSKACSKVVPANSDGPCLRWLATHRLKAPRSPT